MSHDGGRILIGIGGWTFEPWRGTFYPQKLAQSRELEYASQRLTSIEINGTYYGSQKPESFAKWREETPPNFIFSLKASRFCTNRKVLAEGGASIEKFVTSGLVELKEKLGPINWQFMATKKFDPADFEAFLKLLPKSIDGLTLRHAVEVRHDSFANAEFIDMARSYGVAVIYTDKADFPNIADATAPFVYARLQRASEHIDDGYSLDALKDWEKRVRIWSRGAEPDDLPHVGKPEQNPPKERDVFLYMINGFKPKAPMAAMALIERLSVKGR